MRNHIIGLFQHNLYYGYIFPPGFNVIFWPSTRPKNTIPRWYTGRKWHIPMASNRKRSRGRIKAYNMGQGEGPTVPLQRVTCELHDSYFRLMTIKHLISKIQWAIVWALNYYLTQLSSTSQSSCQQTSRELETRCGKESHTRPMGLKALMNWGPEKMLIRCSKESQHPAVDPKTSGWASKRTRKTQRDGHK